MKNKDKAAGIIFPILPHHVERFFEGNKTVFVKFFGKQGQPLKLQVGSKLFFYKSKSDKEIVGEATISEIGTATSDDLTKRYSERLFLSPIELDEYVGDRKLKKLLYLVLKNPRKYKIPFRLDKPVTMAGQYMTLEAYRILSIRVQ